MHMNSNEIEVSEYTDEGYRSLVEYGDWRVAILNYIDELEINNLKTMQKHTESDEVFVLLSGDFVLFSAGDGEEIGEISAIKLEPGKLYNVKKNVWHTHTLSEGSSVLIVENRDTDRHGDSPTKELSEEQKVELVQKSLGCIIPKKMV